MCVCGGEGGGIYSRTSSMVLSHILVFVSESVDSFVICIIIFI